MHVNKHCFALTGLLEKLSLSFNLTTDERADHPEFTITCRTQGGPAKTAIWYEEKEGKVVGNNASYETSQHILSTSEVTVYDNTLKVRGRRYGNYSCIIQSQNTLKKSLNILGKEIKVFL